MTSVACVRLGLNAVVMHLPACPGPRGASCSGPRTECACRTSLTSDFQLQRSGATAVCSNPKSIVTKECSPESILPLCCAAVRCEVAAQPFVPVLKITRALQGAPRASGHSAAGGGQKVSGFCSTLSWLWLVVHSHREHPMVEACGGRWYGHGHAPSTRAAWGWERGSCTAHDQWWKNGSAAQAQHRAGTTAENGTTYAYAEHKNGWCMLRAACGVHAECNATDQSDIRACWGRWCVKCGSDPCPYQLARRDGEGCRVEDGMDAVHVCCVNACCVNEMLQMKSHGGDILCGGDAMCACCTHAVNACVNELR